LPWTDPIEAGAGFYLKSSGLWKRCCIGKGVWIDLEWPAVFLTGVSFHGKYGLYCLSRGTEILCDNEWWLWGKQIRTGKNELPWIDAIKPGEGFYLKSSEFSKRCCIGKGVWIVLELPAVLLTGVSFLLCDNELWPWRKQIRTGKNELSWIDAIKPGEGFYLKSSTLSKRCCIGKEVWIDLGWLAILLTGLSFPGRYGLYCLSPGQ
jgi:hypothetical protein